VQPTFCDKPLKSGFRQSVDIHRLFTDEVDEPADMLRFTFVVQTHQRFGRTVAAGLNFGFCFATRADAREIQDAVPAVKVILNLRNDHVAFAYQNPVADVKLQIRYVSQIVQCRSGHFTAVDFGGVKDSHRRDFAEPRGVPFDFTQYRCVQLILELKRDAILCR